MRLILISLAAVLYVGLSGAQATDRHMFIIGNDGYGIDRCLAGGEKCGAAAANAYCKSQKFAHAAYYRKVDRSEITGAIPHGDASGCRGGRCENFVAILCTR
jgi:hypothetical protein